MARELGRTFNVTFVESLGLRRPQLNKRDVTRAWRRLRARSEADRFERPIPDGVRVISPRVIPYHRGLSAFINRRILRRALSGWLQSAGPKVLWTYSPVTYGLEISSDCNVYHLVDLLGSFPGISASLIEARESDLRPRTDRALGSSKQVVAHLHRAGFVETEYWPTSVHRTEDRPRRAVFAGNLSDKKIDQELLLAVVESGIELHLAGPVAEGGSDRPFDLESLVAAGAIYHGMLAPSELADLFSGCSVGLIPYRINAYTQGVYPLKVWEYLAAGLSVISTELPSMEDESDGEDVFVARGVEAFKERLAALEESDELDRRRRSRKAAAHGWVERGGRARHLVDTFSICSAIKNSIGSLTV
ncbi:hypothetical protein Pfo_031563 [Paulownia fortunei]|nr:hypothetical protein Pfo_031563 [Paulownia fortunei]